MIDLASPRFEVGRFTTKWRCHMQAGVWPTSTSLRSASQGQLAVSLFIGHHIELREPGASK